MQGSADRRNLNFRTPIAPLLRLPISAIDRKCFNRLDSFAARSAGREPTNTQLSIFLSHLKALKNVDSVPQVRRGCAAYRRHHFRCTTIAV
jgi:hypothetical protein